MPSCVVKWCKNNTISHKKHQGITFHRKLKKPGVTNTMEALQSSITATCPLPFQGVTGQLFARAVAAVVTAHCTLFDDYEWPRDNAEEILKAGPRAFDFIVVGAGTAGSAIAGRLTELNPSWTVLLIEAGDDPSLNSEVPAFLTFNQDIDWKYQTKVDNKSCLSSNGNQCTWNKGKALGGSSAINAMLYVRGHPGDYEKWKDMGNTGWGYADLKPYFDKIERSFDFPSYVYHENPWYNILSKTYEEKGLFQHSKENNEGNLGTRITKLVTRDGKRLNSAKIYLKEKEHFYLMKNSAVHKVIIDRTSLTAKGLEVNHKSGIVMQIMAKKEIILSAGSVATPHILMLSGIGPTNLLNEKGIECLADLPVGQNVQDHIILPLIFKTNLHSQITHKDMISFLIQYMLTRTGPISNIGLTDFMTFYSTQTKNNYPDIQFHHAYFAKNDNFMLRSYFEGFGFKKDVIDRVEKLNEESDILGIYPVLLHPKSKGKIKIRDSNPKSSLEIITNYFQNPEDIQTLIDGIQFARKLEQTEAFQALGIEYASLDLPECAIHLFDSDEYWECYIRHLGATIYHPVGSVKMGPKADPTSVVDETLKLHGVQNLRVVDASIMPIITGGNTMAPTLVIAEKAFDIMRNHYNFKDEL